MDVVTNHCGTAHWWMRDLPFEVFAASSIDALVHAVESALSPKATDFTRLLSYRAAEIIIKNYLEIAERGRERACRCSALSSPPPTTRVSPSAPPAAPQSTPSRTRSAEPTTSRTAKATTPYSQAS